MSNFFTKLASSVGIVTLVAASTSASLVSAASEFLQYANTLADNGVINSTDEAGYRLSSNITRAELAKVVANLGGYEALPCVDTYSDVPASHSLCGYVEALADAGVISTSSPTFRPNANVTRAEMIKMILGAIAESPSTEASPYSDTANLGDLTGWIVRANELGCVSDASNFRPNANSSRGEAFKVAVMCAYGDTTTPTPTPTPTPGTGTTSTGTVAMGALTASLSGTAMAQYVPKNASSVKVGSVVLTAGSTDVTVRSLVVTRSGLGNASDIETNNGIRAAQNGMIVSSSSDFYNSTSQKGTVYFYPALTVKAGASQTVDILVNLSGAENSQHQFALTAVNADNTTVTGTPITLGLLNTTSYVTTSVTVAGSATFTATPGKTQQNIAKVDLTAGSRDVTVNGFTLTRSGSNDLTKKFANVKVYKNGVAVGTAVVTADKLSVMGLNTTLAAGNFQSFEVKADVLVDGSASSNTLGFKIESSADVSATEVATGYSTTTSGFGSFAETITFSNVDVTYSKQSTANQTVAPGASNVTLFDAKVTSTVPLNVRQLVITPSGTNSGVSSFANDQLSVKVNGSEVATITSSDFTGATTAFTKTVSIPVDTATTARITIVGSSIKNTVAGSQAYTFQVKLADVRDAANNSVSLLTDTVTGDKTTVQAPTLTLKNAAAGTNSTLSNTTNQEVGRFGLSAEGDAVRVTKVVLNATFNTGTQLLSDLVDASSIELRSVDAGNIGAKLQGTVTLSGNTVTVDSMTNDIAKDATQTIAVLFTNVKSLDNYYGKVLTFTLVTGGLTTTTVNGGATVTLGGTTSMKAYTIGVVPPTVLVTANNPLDYGSKIATVKFTNQDSNTGITLSGIVITVGANTTLNSAVTFPAGAVICLREATSGVANGNPCSSSGTTTGQSITAAGGTYTFTQADLLNIANLTSVLNKNGGNADVEIYIGGLTSQWRSGDFVSIKVDKVNYLVGSVVSTQNYQGVAGASTTATK